MICRKLYLQRMDLTQKTWMLCEIEEGNFSEGCVGRTPAYDFKISPRTPEKLYRGEPIWRISRSRGCAHVIGCREQ